MAAKDLNSSIAKYPGGNCGNKDRYVFDYWYTPLDAYTSNYDHKPEKREAVSVRRCHLKFADYPRGDAPSNCVNTFCEGTGIDTSIVVSLLHPTKLYHLYATRASLPKKPENSGRTVSHILEFVSNYAGQWKHFAALRCRD